MDMNISPPEMAAQIHRHIRKITRNSDPYRTVKDQFCKLALKLYPKLHEQTQASDDPFQTAIRLAIAGNIIDFGVNSILPETAVHEAIEHALNADIDSAIIEQFRTAVNNAENIMYIADNTGEIVFDRLLLEQLPVQKVIFVVRGAPIINDATMEDAQLAGITDLVKVIDNGFDAPGTIVEKCSETFKKHFNDADLIISKGQGNYETLNDSQKNIFFLLRAKCPPIAKKLNCNLGDIIIARTNNLLKN